MGRGKGAGKRYGRYSLVRLFGSVFAVASLASGSVTLLHYLSLLIHSTFIPSYWKALWMARIIGALTLIFIGTSSGALLRKVIG